MSDIPASEPIGHVAGQPDVTAWRRAARRHQSRWREAHGWPPGVQRKRRHQGGGFRPIGSRVDEALARELSVNFLSDAARRAARYRIAHPEPHQTLDETRLFCDEAADLLPDVEDFRDRYLGVTIDDLPTAL